MADWVRVAEAGECPPGEVLAVEAAGERIVLANVDGDVYALKDNCTHQDFPLSEGELVDGTQIECTYHGARFDVCTGKATRLPAIRPVKTYEVELRDGELFVRVD